MTISIIVAFDSNRLIGKNNQLPWHLPADLKHFKEITMGHHMIMGRKTFESIGKPLPGRTSIIVTRQNDYSAEGCIVFNSIEHAIAYCKDENEVFFIGGAELFNHAMKYADKLYLTEIHHAFEGDTYFQEINSDIWQEVFRENHFADEKNKWDFTYLNYIRKK